LLNHFCVALYNLAEYNYYNVATIEWETSNNRYHARVGFTAPDGHYVFFNSYHDDFTDAEHTINFVREGKANGKLYNIYAETIDVHISPTLGITCEVLSLIYHLLLYSQYNMLLAKEAMMFARLKRLAEWLDTQLRFADLALQRTNGSAINEKLRLYRHPLDAVMWPAVVVGAIWTEMPTLDSHLLVGMGVMFIAFGILLVGVRYSFQQQKPVSWDLQFQVVFILGLCLILWSTGPETAQKWRPYRHFLILVAAIVAVSLLTAPWMVKRFFAPLRKSKIYKDFLTKTELFQRRVGEQPAEGSLALALQVLASAFSRAPL